ncbi:hypothetical protein K08M3_26680 [Vibrio alginolyticus]|uniref:Uncharacterized protein n=1 Tax=Vibrio alginolyticus TaxID=663 RepID=A0A1W6TF22_VIBAL|nr:hypothetical protein K01M1_26620 [Vibrio alginolyticus]ARP04297.1 hypothetical protein K04M1_26770 [Vibrio alginolyticus]ARP09354.1 hypothetical protein K04M3_26780 [Vibrio alginolyticus]ARP14432.1 hypothetical protein K04M5_26680 [Vibrio alginolyticus]ARP19491.1 hypothetical protein K05K4_26810 [Vibrio alginolyticus]
MVHHVMERVRAVNNATTITMTRVLAEAFHRHDILDLFHTFRNP